MTLGYGLQSGAFPLAVAIGDSVPHTVPLLWVVMVCATLPARTVCSSPISAGRAVGLAKPMRYYLMSIRPIVPLIMALIMFDNLNDREFPPSLGRLCFMLICGALAMVTLEPENAPASRFISDKEGSGDNMLNRTAVEYAAPARRWW